MHKTTYLIFLFLSLIFIVKSQDCVDINEDIESVDSTSYLNIIQFTVYKSDSLIKKIWHYRNKPSSQNLEIGVEQIFNGRLRSPSKLELPDGEIQHNRGHGSLGVFYIDGKLRIEEYELCK